MVVYIGTALLTAFVFIILVCVVDNLKIVYSIAALMVFPMYLLAYTIQEDGVKYTNSWKVWRENMVVKGCKRSSFVATKTEITPVWTCPDGTAYLDRG
jgi:hypothetical protein